MYVFSVFFLIVPPPPRSTLFPYTTLFRSWNPLPPPSRSTARVALWPSAEPSDAQSRAPSQQMRSEEHTSELQSRQYLVCRLLLEKKNLKTATAQKRATTYTSDA